MKLLSTLRRNKVSIFSLRDIANMFPDANLGTLKNNLTNWLKKGYIERLKRDQYMCIEPVLESEIPEKEFRKLAEQVKPFLFREDDIELVLKAPLYGEKFLAVY